jgi:predicted dehydrogenase
MTKKNQYKKTQSAKSGTDRRDFIKTTAAASAGFWLAGGISPRPSRMAVDEIQFAAIGCGGKGGQDSSSLGKLGQMVALCDIDTDNLDKKKNEFPDAKRYFDFRKMLDEMGDKIDAVNVSTPDHTHAVATLMAMRKGIHCYTQKPLTHSIEEARLLAEVAREKKDLVTQMGNQGTALTTLRRSAALVKAGVIGDVSEVHVWTNRPVWPQAKGMQVKTETPPEKIKWDLWLGPRPKREFSHEIHPFKWRGFWDFGTGALGDMACHTLNMSFMALNMRNPVSIKAETDGHDGNVFPKWSVIEYTFDIGKGKELKMFWYDGTKMPPRELLKDLPLTSKGKHFASAALIVGDKGRFYSPGDYGGDRQNTGTVIDGVFTPLRRITEPAVEFPKSPGIYKEFAAAIKGEMKTVSNFPDYAGPLTEVVLLGNLAVWEPNKLIKWDSEKLEAENATPAMKKLIRHDYENGFSIKANSKS